MIYGEIDGVKKSYIQELELLYDVKVNKNFIIDEFVLKKIAEISLKINKEICVVISRLGIVHSISIGTNVSAEIKIDSNEKKKLSGYRVVHTHLNSFPNLSNVDIASLKNLKLDAISAVNVTNEKLLESFSIGFLNFDNQNNFTEIIFKEEQEYFNFDIFSVIQEIEKNLKVEIYDNEINENSVLIGCDSKESLEELKELAFACNVNVCDMFFQKREKIDKSYYIGKGKLQEILQLTYHKNVDVLIFDEDLSPSQIRNLEEFSGIKVIDRTNLILEIFARRAKSKVSKYQVELAQLKYRYSRLKGLGFVLNRTGGGIGTRGPGEKKLETDRRHIRNRIDYLKEQLKIIKSERNVQRECRIKNKIPQVSIVGYTNAGKSTLRNYIYSISNDNVLEDKFIFEADMLFATLDTTTRKVVLPKKTIISLTDTVGFIKKLPHDLVEAFKSTLEEIIYSDLLIHVVDISSKTWKEEIETTDFVLGEIGIKNPNKILVFNKIDKLKNSEFQDIKTKIEADYGTHSIFISAIEKINIDGLLESIENKLNVTNKNISVNIPYSDYSILNSIYNNYIVLKEEHLDNGTFVNFDVPEDDFKKYEKYIIKDLEK